MKAISFNGRDNSGKSQQVRFLKWKNEEFFHVTKPLSAYSTRWPNLHGCEASRWWFEEVGMRELTDIIIESLIARQEDFLDGKISIYDRGVKMFKAVCAATRMTRENILLSEAISITNRQFASASKYLIEEYEVFLEADPVYFREVEDFVEIVRPREDAGFPENIRQQYQKYQSNLSATTGVYFGNIGFHIRVGEPILLIQNQIRERINFLYKIKLPLIKPVTQLIVGFGGLSESGKSSFAEYLRTSHNFCRLKLRYFIESLEKRSQEVTPEAVCFELLDYLERHYFLTRISIESLHDPFIPSMLKLMLGSRMQIVYIEVEHSIRVRRTALELGITFKEVEDIVSKKDKIKRDRGAERVKGIADIVFNNSSDSHESSLATFSNLLFL